LEVQFPTFVQSLKITKSEIQAQQVADKKFKVQGSTFKIIFNLQMSYLSSPYGKTDSPSIKLSSRDAVDGINKESSPCPYYKRINRYGSAFLKHIAKKQLCYKS
jgi:hypothetical protein